jgi:hypothetical protein
MMRFAGRRPMVLVVAATLMLALAGGSSLVLAQGGTHRNPDGTLGRTEAHGAKKKKAKKPKTIVLVKCAAVTVICKGKSGPTGPTGPAGANGAAGTTGFTSTLPVGKTEQGTYALSKTNGTSPLPAWEGVSFVIPLAAPIPFANVSLITPGGAPTSACPGSATKPQATSGHLCIYEAENINTGGPFVFNPDVPGGESGAGAFGFAIGFNPLVNTSDWGGYGTWAVTG